ncbi:hypothetical protein EDC04DRAFT_2580832, partial [Pisolithus marmoratus]
LQELLAPRKTQFHDWSWTPCVRLLDLMQNPAGTPPLVLWAHYLFGIFHDMLQSQYGGGRGDSGGYDAD